MEELKTEITTILTQYLNEDAMSYEVMSVFSERAMLAFKEYRNYPESWDDESNTMRVIPGKYEVMVGNSSADKNMKTIIVKIKP